METAETSSSAVKVLKQYFGYDRFRPMQAEIINAVLAKKDVLVLMPTGGGKSVCYQVPALLLPGTTVVISPLIALMKDQVEALRVNGVEAGFLNSSLSSREQAEIEKKCLSGKLKLLYVSPEKLFTESFQWLLGRITVNLFAIDEAHCISFWGHDFRPEYTQLKILKELYPSVPVIALTATADKITRKDIISQLHLQEPEVFIASFDRPNLSLTVLPGIKRQQRLIAFLEAHPFQPGIVYCLSRKTTEAVAQKLEEAGFRARAYHAGLPPAQRSQVQEAFLKDDIQIVCATIAFGMGIDKSNVRWVVHFNLPKNIESYYQEIGRAGRDGASAQALLFYTYSDVALQQQMLEEMQGNHRILQEAKLARLQQYAETLFCRRRILLNYFNEDYTEERCGNCDNCREPRKMADGTEIAQKALSAVARTKEQIGVNLLIDILRGSRTQAVVSKEYHLLKTFGAGRNLRPLDWRDYIHQLINLGCLDIAYDENHRLKLTARSRNILFNGEQVELAEPQAFNQKAAVPEEPQRTKSDMMKDELFERLRNLRKQIADKEGIPPYIVFNDNTLLEMARDRPTNRQTMLRVAGVGFNKFDSYGEAFIEEITAYINGQASEGSRIKGATHLATYELLRQGYSPADISLQRKINMVTVYSHIASLYEGGYDIELDKYLSLAERKAIFPVIEKHGMNARLKDIFESLGQQYDYFKIRLALAAFAKERSGAVVG